MIKLLRMGVLSCFCKLGQDASKELVHVGLKGIMKFLRFEKKVLSEEDSDYEYVIELRRFGLRDVYEMVKTHDDKEISELALKISDLSCDS